ncbi:MAG: class I SAM-dependent methyltransferase [Planctomycetes bacterium]|nr:class I SAM-dependent methyltransferase [Planctomycetota bacterium]
MPPRPGHEVRFLPALGRLAYYGEASTPRTWQTHWEVESFDVARSLAFAATDRYTRSLVDSFLPSPRDAVLEAGCGIGGHVHALRGRGLRVAGVDWSFATLARTRRTAPDLPLCAGDVRTLPFRDGAFGLVLSFGVIEHFPEGFAAPLRESARVLRPGGRLAVTFPALNPLRRLRIRLGRYPEGEPTDDRPLYQYVLDPPEVVRAAEGIGFRLLRARGRNGLKGIREDVAFLRPLADRLVSSRSTFLPFRAVKHLLDLLLAPVCGHMAELVFER